MNLIMTLCLTGSTIWTFVDILVDVFDSLDRATDLQIYMTVKLHQQLPRMRNYMYIVKDTLALFNSPAIVRVSIIRITTLLDNGLRNIRLGKVPCTNIPFNTPLRRARTMKHISGDN